MSEAREYLERLKMLDVMIDGKQEELTALDGMVKRITPVMNPAGGAGGGNTDKMGNTMAKLIDLQNEINRDVDEFVNLKREVSAMLQKVKKPEYYQVLHKRYVLYENFVKIAAAMNLTERGASKLNGRALQVFDKVLEDYRKEKEKQAAERIALNCKSIVQPYDERVRKKRGAGGWKEA